jgi:hypothetical protein
MCFLSKTNFKQYFLLYKFYIIIYLFLVLMRMRNLGGQSAHCEAIRVFFPLGKNPRLPDGKGRFLGD